MGCFAEKTRQRLRRIARMSTLGKQREQKISSLRVRMKERSKLVADLDAAVQDSQ